MAKFVKRTECPTPDNYYYYDGNIFYQSDPSDLGLPNCTCYAWGRFYELTGEYPRLCIHNAEEWYDWDDGYSRGTTPKLGAVIVWARGVVGDNDDGAGHVAVVEEIYDDGRFLVSASGYGGPMFWLETVNADGSRDGSPAYRFLGFIYNPINFEEDTPPVQPDIVDKSEVVSGNRYLSESEMQINARYLCQELTKRGWTLNAIAGMIGNFEKESTINPAIWESLDYGDREQGYGLVQWTPASKYLDWCAARGLDPADMDSAIARIEYELAEGEQYYATDEYPLSFSEFKTSTRDPYWLGMAFVSNYARPAEITTERGELSEKWYSYLKDFDTGGGIPDTPNVGYKRHDMPLWLLVAACGRN